jgi:hypothetical protein
MRFPHAQIDMQNLAIGGFASQLLYKTVEMDVSAFYPDLVLLHIYGSDQYYDSVLHTIRSRTAAEVAIMTDHYTSPDAWSDSMSYQLLPVLAEKYKCDIINIRDPWKQYLQDHQLEPSALLIDEVHLNEYGNFLMAELVKSYFDTPVSQPYDQCTLETDLHGGKDFNFQGDTLTFQFVGNRVDVIWDSLSIMDNSILEVRVDGKPPSAYQGTYFISRPYNASGKQWPWDLPAMIRIQHTRPWIHETWTCTLTRLKKPYNRFSFSIEGSVTGPDGKGNAGKDFYSNSGRIIIMGGEIEQGGDWHLKRSFEVLKTRLKNGDYICWDTYSIGADSISPSRSAEDPQNLITLFQGISNEEHTLQLIKKSEPGPAIKMIKIYKPLIIE